MRVALDTMIFIYMFEANPDYSSQLKLLFDRIEQGKFQAVTSFISPLEVFSSPAFEEATDRLVTYSHFFQKSPNLSLVPVNWEIALQAAQLRRKHRSLKTPDAIQVATGIVEMADTFITNDERLTRLKLPLKITPIGEYR